MHTFINADLEADHFNQIRGVYCLAAMFANVAKKDKEKRPERYWIEDYEVRRNCWYILSSNCRASLN